MSSANTALQVLFELVRIESAKLVEQQRLFLSPDANKLGHFLLDGHAAQEILEPGFHREPAILIKGHVFTAPGSLRRGFSIIVFFRGED